MDLFKATLSRKTGDAGEKVSVKGFFIQFIPLKAAETNVVCQCSWTQRKSALSWQLAPPMVDFLHVCCVHSLACS